MIALRLDRPTTDAGAPTDWQIHAMPGRSIRVARIAGIPAITDIQRAMRASALRPVSAPSSELARR